MPSLFTAFTSEIFQPLVTLLIPGAIAVSTWLIAVLWHFAHLTQLADQNRTEATLIIFLLMTFAGLSVEDIGSHFEKWLDKCKDAKTSGTHTKQWNEYLRIAFIADPIGRRYARTLVLRLKFELGIVFGMASAALGLVWLAVLGLKCSVTLVSFLACLIFIAWNYYEVTQTHEVLGETRTELLKDIRIVSDQRR
jgi:hypothetical protein